MSKLGGLTSVELKNLVGADNITKAGLAINAASAATFKTASAITYILDGVFKTKTALAAQAFSSGHAQVPTGYACLFVVGLDGSGNVSTYQGDIFSPTKALGPDGNLYYYGYTNKAKQYLTSGAYLPDVPNGVVPIGIIKVVNASAGAFVPGTTALDGAGLTVTYYDVANLPSQYTDL